MTTTTLIDPCVDGVTTLFYVQPCTSANPPLPVWCQDPSNAQFLIDSTGYGDLCNHLPVTVKPVPLPVTGAIETLTISGLGALLIMIGAVLLRKTRRVYTA